MVLFSILIQGCTIDPVIEIEGYWNNKGTVEESIMIIDKIHYYSVNKERSKPKLYDKHPNGIYNNSEEKINLISENEIEISGKNGEINIYIRPEKKVDLQLWAITKGMSREYISKFFSEPTRIVKSDSGAEKWIYPNNKVIVFDEKSIIKLEKNYFVERDYSLLKEGMDKSEVLSKLGNPDRKNKRDSKWYYGLDYQLVFRNDKLAIIKVISNQKEAFLSWREEAMSTFDDRKLIRKDVANNFKLTEFLEEGYTLLPYKNISRVYGIKGKETSKFPLIIIGEVDQTGFFPSIRKLEKDLKRIETRIENLVKENLSNVVKNIDVIKPKLIKDRQLLIIESNLELVNGDKLIINQAIFFRNNEMLLIQAIMNENQKEKMKYFDEIIDDFDI